MNKPLFSVIVLTYNRSELLKGTIQSILEQTYKDFELIVIDDHSTDNTRNVVASFDDKRIKYFLNDQTKGQPGARNAGINKSEGEWITFLDDDDIWLPTKLEKQYNKISEIDKSVGFIYTGYATYDFDNDREITVFVPEKEGELQKDLLYKNYVGAICSVAIRRELFDKAGGFDVKFQSMVDMEMWVRLAEFTRFAYISEKLVYIRQSNSDRISLNPRKKMEGSLQFWKKYKEIIEQHPKLHHRAASRVFVYAFRLCDKKQIMKSLPWTLAGIVIDPSNIIWILQNTFGVFYREKIRPL